MGQETTAPALVRRRDLRKQEEAARRAERKLPFLRSAVASPAPRTEDLVERRSSGTVGARSIATRGSDGSAVRATSVRTTIDGTPWQRWSRHRTSQNPWRPGVDGIPTHLALVEHWLEYTVELERHGKSGRCAILDPIGH